MNRLPEKGRAEISHPDYDTIPSRLTGGQCPSEPRTLLLPQLQIHDPAAAGACIRAAGKTPGTKRTKPRRVSLLAGRIFFLVRQNATLPQQSPGLVRRP